MQRAEGLQDATSPYEVAARTPHCCVTCREIAHRYIGPRDPDSNPNPDLDPEYVNGTGRKWGRSGPKLLLKSFAQSWFIKDIR